MSHTGAPRGPPGKGGSFGDWGGPNRGFFGFWRFHPFPGARFLPPKKGAPGPKFFSQSPPTPGKGRGPGSITGVAGGPRLLPPPSIPPRPFPTGVRPGVAPTPTILHQKGPLQHAPSGGRARLRGPLDLENSTPGSKKGLGGTLPPRRTGSPPFGPKGPPGGAKRTAPPGGPSPGPGPRLLGPRASNDGRTPGIP